LVAYRSLVGFIMQPNRKYLFLCAYSCINFTALIKVLLKQVPHLPHTSWWVSPPTKKHSPMGKRKDDEKTKAYELYCNTNLTQKEIAAVVGVSATQMSGWAKKGNWEMYRTANQVTVEQLIYETYQQLAAINKDVKDNFKGIPTSAHAQAKSTLTGDIEKLRKRHNLSAYHSVLRECLEWLTRVDGDKAKSFGPLMLEFLTEKAKALNNDKNIG